MKKFKELVHLADSYCEGNWITFISVYPTNFEKDIPIFYYSSFFMYEPNPKFFYSYEEIEYYKEIKFLENKENFLLWLWKVLTSKLKMIKERGINKDIYIFIIENKKNFEGEERFDDIKIDGKRIVINFITLESFCQDKEFIAKMEFISKERHKNVSFIFIFKSRSFLTLKIIFKNFHGVILSSGNNTMKGLLSISEYNIINFFQQFYFNNEYIEEKIYESFNILSSNKALTKSLLSLEAGSEEIERFLNSEKEVRNHVAEYWKFHKKFKEIRPGLQSMWRYKRVNKNFMIPPGLNLFNRRDFHTTSYLISKVGKGETIEKYSSFLSNIVGEVLEKYKDEPEKAQRILEEEWVELIKERFDVNPQLRKNNKIITKVLKLISESVEKGSFRNYYEMIEKDIPTVENVFISYYHLISGLGHNETYIASLITRGILFNIYNKKYKKKYKKINKNYLDFLYSLGINAGVKGWEGIKGVELGQKFILAFTELLIDPPFKRVIYSYKDSIKIELNESYSEKLIRNLIVKPLSLPMVSRPLEWGKDKIGGHFLNTSNLTFTEKMIKGSEQHSHTMEIGENNIIYEIINKLNSQIFRMNNELLDFFSTEKGKMMQQSFKENNKENWINFRTILEIAEIYRDKPIFFNHFYDWRGRIYNDSFYINYQGGDFSSPFINFAKGEKLTKEGEYYFFIYGANIYNENGTSKKRLEERDKWVRDNMEKIIEIDLDFIIKAENPISFLSFSLELLKYSREGKNYLHHSPMFLDATCSGIQHFAGMLRNYALAKEVNLIESENVKDFYKGIVNPINKAINTSPDKPSFFQEILLDRKILKRIIMTRGYGVTREGIKNQLVNISDKEEIEKEDGKKITLFKIPSKSAGFVKLDINEIRKLSFLIYDNIFISFPEIDNLYKYLKEYIRVYVKLELIVSWLTPAGLRLQQSYNKSVKNKISLNFLGVRKTVVLRDWKEELDKRKQINAFIPNIVHSLDAAHLHKVIHNWRNEKYILPIHDCFGSHPNYMLDLYQKVALNFIEIYSQKDFLKSLERKLIKDLKDHLYEIKIKDGRKVIEIEKGRGKIEEVTIPKLPKLGKLKLDDIKLSRYMIT